MKKIGVILIFAFAIFAFIGCGDEGTALRWKNASYDNSDGYDGIQWVPYAGAGSQTWNEIPVETQFTDYKQVSFEHGRGEVLDGGEPTALRFQLKTSDPDMAGVKLPGNEWAVLEKDSDATLVIETVFTK